MTAPAGSAGAQPAPDLMEVLSLQPRGEDLFVGVTPPTRASPADSKVRSLTKVSAAACTASTWGSRPVTRNQAREVVSGGVRGLGSNGSARYRCSTARARIRRVAAFVGWAATTSSRPGSDSGPGTSGIGSECSTTGRSPAWKSAVSAKMATSEPLRVCRASTRRVLNDRPSRSRSTSKRISSAVSPGRRK